MDYKTIVDLLYFAISKEQASQKFYNDMARQIKDTATQKIFEAIAKQEEHHEEALRLEVLKQGYTIDAGKADALSTQIHKWSEGTQADIDVAKMTYVDALSIAIDKERDAFRLYTQMLAMTQDLEFRKALLDLAEEEMRHVIQFEREYDAVSHS